MIGHEICMGSCRTLCCPAGHFTQVVNVNGSLGHTSSQGLGVVSLSRSSEPCFLVSAYRDINVDLGNWQGCVVSPPFFPFHHNIRLYSYVFD